VRDRNRADLDLAALLLARRSRLRRVQAGRKAGVAVLVAVAVLAVLLAGAAASGRAVLLDTCSLNALAPVGLGQNSFLYADNGTLLGVVPSSVYRQPLRLDQISPYLRTGTVAIEDRRFWHHGALDYQGILRALYSDVAAGRIVQGGSTITQELVRNLYIGNASRTLSRKVKEACLAIKLAQVWSKPRILNAYLNEVFYGQAAHGAQAAAETFFSTRAQDLSLAQSALLAGLPQAPTVYDPLLHPAAAMERRDEVLRAMLANRAITTDEYARAVAAPLGLKPGTLYKRQQHENFLGWAEQQLVAKYGAHRVAAGGLRVRTTLEPSMQESALSSPSIRGPERCARWSGTCPTVRS
jgi:penicillin-binding protein 1A